jgi:hypothetical protein
MRYLLTVFCLLILFSTIAQIPISNPLTPRVVNQTDTLSPGFYLINADESFEVVLRDRFGTWNIADSSNTLFTNPVTVKVPEGKTLTIDAVQVIDGQVTLSSADLPITIGRPKSSDDYFIVPGGVDQDFIENTNFDQDANSAIQQGVYQSTTNSLLNGPNVSLSWMMDVEVTKQKIKQTYYTDTQVFIRYSFNGGSNWTNWAGR